MSHSTDASPTDDSQVLRDRITRLKTQLGTLASDHERLSQENRLLHAAIDSMAVGVVIADPNLPDTPLTFVNPGFVTMTGYTPDEAVGRNCRFLQGGDTDPAHLAAIREAITARRPIDITLRNYRRDGTPFWNELIINPVYDEAGGLLAFVGVQVDVTARIQAEAELRAREAQLHSVVQASPILLIATDAAGVVTLAAGAALHTLVGTEAAPVGQYFLHWQQHQPALCAMAERALAGATGQVIVEASGTRLELTCIPLTDLDGQVAGLIVVGVDVTLHQIAAAALAENQRQEVQIAAQQAMLAELSTPLLTIADGVVVLPVIGALDTNRAQQVQETLLYGVSRQHARVALIDITGVPLVDTQVARALLEAVQAVRLLGAQVVITGIRPEVAQTLIGLGVDFSAVHTQSTLQAGMALALRSLRAAA